MRSRFLAVSCAVSLTAIIGTTGAHALQPPVPPVPVVPSAVPPPLFSDAERTALVSFWNAPGREEISAPPDAAKTGAWQVRLTTEGSAWLLGYQRAIRGGGKVIPPSQDAHASDSSPQSDWETWLTARVAYDRYQAAVAAANANASIASGTTASALTAPLPSLAAPTLVPPLPAAPTPVPAPGPIPASLLTACGNPPRLARAVSPLQYTIHIDDPTDIYIYQDNVKMRERFAYYRFSEGTVSYGKKLEDFTDQELGALFQKAGFTPSEQRIFTAVSGLEGGFETVNTYDTGFVSVGFIQFITLAEGHEDLARVMAEEKISHYSEFQKDFHRLGLDIQPSDGTLTVVDPATGAELVGNPAVLKVIEDKRLTAVFQRAGRKSDFFRVAQIKTARASYWPASDPVQITLSSGAVINGVVSDFIKSEAGMATLLDRKVNIGNIRQLTEVASQKFQAHKCQKISDLAQYEREIVAAMKYRSDFLLNTSLSQPK